MRTFFGFSKLRKNILCKKVGSDQKMKIIRGKEEHLDLLIKLLEELPLFGKKLVI